MADCNDGFKKRMNSENKAEQKCQEYLNSKKDIFWSRFGWDEDLGDFFFKLPKMMWKMPDYIFINNIESYFLEAKGCYGVLQFKYVDYDQYIKWNEIMKVVIYVCDFKNLEAWLIPLNIITRDIQLLEIYQLLRLILHQMITKNFTKYIYRRLI